MGNRLPGGCVGASRQRERKTHRQNQNAIRFGCFGFTDACSAPLFSACSACRKRNRPAVGYPPYVLQHFLAFLPYSFGILMHRAVRDARVPVGRGFAPIVCQSADGGRISKPMRVQPPLFSSCFARRKHNRPAVGCPPYDHQCINRSPLSADYRLANRPFSERSPNFVAARRDEGEQLTDDTARLFIGFYFEVVISSRYGCGKRS
ncbi:MAG: hypothetical protein LBQ66_07970 [Planctomycetaceae bacterium]|nr:hypothetical protein [Planctomycetaceae bacterium]